MTDLHRWKRSSGGANPSVVRFGGIFASAYVGTVEIPDAETRETSRLRVLRYLRELRCCL
jgi:hypothetical protein